ncbi:hypothetical protein [Melaminivora sp.]|uniref:hypothetical protein n=1 Tax=Melaminivora sp. TaxID=1933032 RepID=UPI0028AC4F27|nr:hypothetical protein [Melaminivora sp.]
MPQTTGRRASLARADHRLAYSHAIAPAAGSGALERALLAALRLRRPQVLERLVEQAGAGACAQALSRLSPRQMVDALSLLPEAQRTAVYARLSPSARRRWRALAAERAADDMLTPRDAPELRKTRPAGTPSAAARQLLAWARPWLRSWPWRTRAATSAGLKGSSSLAA